MSNTTPTCKLSAFTMLEIMTALVIFSGSMLAYLGYQASVSKVLYDAQSITTAEHLAEDFVQSISALDYTEFENLVLSVPMDDPLSDNDIAAYVRNLRDDSDNIAFTGPFTAEGYPLHLPGATGSGLFHRHLRINTYGAETNNAGLTVDQLYFYFYHLEVTVSWPRASAPPTTDCSDLTTSGCDHLSIHFLKGRK